MTAVDSNPSPALAKGARKRKLTALLVVCNVAMMIGLAYASVPFYQMFCRLTGYGGTTQVANTAPLLEGSRILSVHFDTNTAPGLNWELTPEQDHINVKTGKTQTVFFRLKNLSNEPARAVATYNVQPDIAGSYFDKITCFCFNEIHLKAKEEVDLPVVFYLDPALEKDETMQKVDAVTLSYTLFASKKPQLSSAPPLEKAVRVE